MVIGNKIENKYNLYCITFTKAKVKLYRALGIQEVRFSEYLDTRQWRWDGRQANAPATFTPKRITLALISARSY